jgi:dTMP kinase
MKKGLFITFEGIDGCGKSTQLAKTANALTEKGYSVITTREPGGTIIAEKIRDILISPENGMMVNECEILLYCAARAQHVHEIIIPAIDQGKIVLCDRFQEATFAYQGFGRSIPIKILTMLNSYATGGLNPDKTFVFDLSVQESFARLEKMNKAKDRLESNGKDFFEKIREGYLSMAKEFPKRIQLIDGTQSVEYISSAVISRGNSQD